MTRPEILKDNREKPKYKVNVSIESANNGWFFKEDYYNNEIFCVTLEELTIHARKIFILFLNDMKSLEKYKEISIIEKIGKVEKTTSKKARERRKKKEITEEPMPVDEPDEPIPEPDEDEDEDEDEPDDDEEEEPDEEEPMPVERKPYLLPRLEKPKLQEVSDRRWLN